MKILLTGASGFIGSYLFQSFLNSGEDVYGIVRKKPNIPFLNNNSHRLIISDLTDFNNLDKLIPKDIDVVIHAGAFNDQDTNLDIKNAYNVNVYGTRNICEIASLRKIKKFIYFSVLQVYGRELKGSINEKTKTICDNDYSLSHFLAEKVCKNYFKTSKTQFLIMRLGYIFGCPIDSRIDRKTLIPFTLCDQLIRKGKIELISKGNARRDFISLNKLYLFIKKIIKRKIGFKVINFVSGYTFSMKEISKIAIKQANKHLNKNIIIKYGDKNDIKNDFKVKSTHKMYKDRMSIKNELGKEIIKIINLINE